MCEFQQWGYKWGDNGVTKKITENDHKAPQRAEKRGKRTLRQTNSDPQRDQKRAKVHP